MEHLPKVSDLQKLKNQFSNIKKIAKERLFFENQREELEQNIFELRKKRDAYLFEKKSSERLDTEKLIESIKVKIHELDHKLDTIDEDTHPSSKEIQERLLDLIFEKSPPAKKHCEMLWKKIESLESTLSSLNEITEVINSVQLAIQKILGTIDQAKNRSLLHYIFGKSPYVIVAKQITELEKTGKQALSEFIPLKKVLELDSMPYESLINDLLSGFPPHWTFKDLAIKLSPISQMIDDELNLLLKKHLQAEKALKEEEDNFELWLETSVENL